jgi:glycosyltransferase involved in cell wall biosynthesis
VVCVAPQGLPNLLVSVVTPSFNSVQYIEKAISSVYSQHFPNIEHIIVDGCSTDGTLDILKGYSHLRWISEPDKGQADALNKGFRMARGEIIGWLNADDTYTENAIVIAIEYLRFHPDVDIVYSDCNWINAEGSPMGKYQAKPYNLRNLVEGCGLIHTPAVFWRRELFEKVGYLNTHYHYSLDNDFWLRACPVSNPLYIDYPLANYRRSTGSKTMSHETEFLPELIDIYEHILCEEPYLSSLDSGTKNDIMGRLYWSCGIVMCQNDQTTRAEPYLLTALREYDILSSRHALYPIISHFLEGYFHPKHLVEKVFGAVPLSRRELHFLRSKVWREYHAALFFRAYKQKGRSVILVEGLRAVRHRPDLLLNRGFVSLFLESLLGRDLMTLIRRVV